MAPTRTVKSKVTGPKGKGRSGTEGSLGSKNRISKLKPKGKPPPPKQQKTKAAQGPAKKKKRVYTDKELGIPKLNTITPVGVEKPKGKKKGKIFVDDRESMMTILAMVNADKEGQIESKMIKARHMEEIREARKKEAEARQAQKLSKLEETKDSIRKKRKRKNAAGDVADVDGLSAPSPRIKADRKRVSFA